MPNVEFRKRNEILIYRGTITGLFYKTVRGELSTITVSNQISVLILRQVLDERKSYYCLSLQVAPLYCHSEFVKDE